MIVITILSAILTPVIAVVTLYIAYQQYKSNKRNSETQNLLVKKKLNFDLYQKRLQVFMETKTILYKIRGEGGIEIKEIENFSNSVKESFFLFEKEIVDFLHEIGSKNIEHYSIRKELDRPSLDHQSEEYEKFHSKFWELANWFSENYNNLENRFIKYLDFRRL